MGLFDYAIRPQGSAPPWKQFFSVPVGKKHRVTSSWLIGTFVILWGHVVLFPRLGLWGYGIYQLVNLALLFNDTMVSNRFGENVENLRRAGFSDVKVLATILANLFSSQLMGYAIMVYIAPISFVDVRLDFVLVARIACSMTVAELGFTLGHWLMHTVPALTHLHVMHHCNKAVSSVSNLIFDPTDLTIEFAGPALGLLALHYFVFQDTFALFMAYLIFQVWYAADHDEGLNLPHADHHLFTNSVYTIYVAASGRPKDNILKQQMSKILEN